MASILGKIQRRLSRLVARPEAVVPPAGIEAYPDWPSLLQTDWSKWLTAIKRARGGRRILIATSVGGYVPGATFESLLAVTLTLRGAEVRILLCDQFLPACLQVLRQSTPNLEEFAAQGVDHKICRACFRPAEHMFRNLGLPVHRYSQFVTAEEVQAADHTAASLPWNEIPNYTQEGLSIGEHAMAGALRYFARGDLEGEPLAEPIVRQYLRAALLSMYAVRRCLATHQIEALVFHHGIYVPQGIVGEVARHAGARVVNWSVAWRKGCFVGSHNDTYHHTFMNEPVQDWENIDLTPARETRVMDYLHSRWQGTQDWIWFHDTPQENEAEILRETGLDRSRPIIGALTNVIWDAQLFYPANAFANMQAWVFETIRYFSERPDLQLVIRIHPAEVRGTVPSRQRMLDEIRREFPVLPANVAVIPPDSQISTYALMAMCNTAIIYGTKTGVELASQGIPIIVAGEAWIRNKGLTRDASSLKEYIELLDQLPSRLPLPPADVERARKYAYHYFFRRTIPVAAIVPSGGPVPFRVQVESLADLEPGRDAGLDVFCDGILAGSSFTFSADVPAPVREPA